MTSVLQQRNILTGSLPHARPTCGKFQTFGESDGRNAGYHIQEKRRMRLMKFPTLRGSVDYLSFQNDINSPPFKRWNDEGDHRAPAPYRDYDNIIDPVSGFVSAGGDVDRNTGHTKIKAMIEPTETPQTKTPTEVHSNRKGEKAAPPEINRDNIYEPGGPSLWNSRKVSDRWIRSQLGGWTSDYDTRNPPPSGLQRSKTMYVTKPLSEQKKDTRDHLALKYMYSSSTQKGYGEVPWDNLLPPKRWAPSTALEPRPDMVSQRFKGNNYEPVAGEWQNAGKSWDRIQMRQGHQKDGWINFSSPSSRKQHIPLYRGCVGADNVEEVDNKQETFNPYTVKRSEIPRPATTGHKPNIPGYQACTKPNSPYAPAHTDPVPPPRQQTSSASAHRSVAVTPNNSAHKRDSQMSKMVTTVPPCNPYNTVGFEATAPNA